MALNASKWHLRAFYFQIPTVYSNPCVQVSHLVVFVHDVCNIHPVLGFVKGVYIYKQAGKIIKMNFPQYLEKKYLEWQQVVGERKTVREFAEYIGVSASSITMWWKQISVNINPYIHTLLFSTDLTHG